MVKSEHFLRLLQVLLVVVNVAFPSLGCIRTLGQEYPQARVYGVCAAPYSIRVETEPEKRVWLYGPNGELVSRRNPEQFAELAAKTREIFVFDEDASRDSPSALPSPDNELECQTGFSWLPPQELDEMPYGGGCRGNCELPDSSVVIAPFAPCPIDNLRQRVSYLQGQGGDRPDVRLLGQTQAPIRSPFLQPLAGVAYAPDCRALMRAALKDQAGQLSEEIGRQFGRAIGDYDASFNSVGVVDTNRRYEMLRQYPLAFETLQLDLAAKLNAIPELPTYEDPEIALAAQKGFEAGYGAGIDEAQRRALAIDLAWIALHAVCGNVACAMETVGARVLQQAITRLRGMPLFVPGATNGIGFFIRIPKTPTKTAGGTSTTFIKNRAPAPMPASRPVAPAAPPANGKVIAPPTSSPAPTNTPKTNAPTITTTTAPQAAPSGELHHGISEEVFKALERHKNLMGKFKLRDPRFTARAANKEAHNGYQDWHRDLDKEVAKYINDNDKLDVKSFTAWLYKRYKQSDLAPRFPGGLGENK